MKKNFLTLFFVVLFAALIFLAGAITGVQFNTFDYENLIVIVLVALVSALIGCVCTKQAKPKKKEKDPKDVYSHSK